MKNQKSKLSELDENINAGNLRGNDVRLIDRGGVCGAEPGTEKTVHGKAREAGLLRASDTEQEISIFTFGANATAQTASIPDSNQSVSKFSPSDLSVEEASALIADGPEFKQSICLSVSAAQDGNQISYSGLVKIRSETMEAAVRRETEVFYRKYPLIWLFVYLDLVRVEISAIEYPEMVVPSLTKWHFEQLCALTASGEERWRKLGGKTDPFAVPIAERKLLTVTDFAAAGDDMLSSKITWQLVPNEIGAYLDANSAAFAALPADLRASLIESGVPAEIGAAYAKMRSGVADFVCGDSGWQLLDTYLEPFDYSETVL